MAQTKSVFSKRLWESRCGAGPAIHNIISLRVALTVVFLGAQFHDDGSCVPVL